MRDGDEGNGLECILPAKQGSQTMSGFSDEEIFHSSHQAVHVYFGDINHIIMATATMPERRSERQGGDPVGRLSKRFSGTREVCTVVRPNSNGAQKITPKVVLTKYILKAVFVDPINTVHPPEL